MWWQKSSPTLQASCMEYSVADKAVSSRSHSGTSTSCDCPLHPSAMQLFNKQEQKTGKSFLIKFLFPLFPRGNHLLTAVPCFISSDGFPDDLIDLLIYYFKGEKQAFDNTLLIDLNISNFQSLKEPAPYIRKKRNSGNIHDETGFTVSMPSSWKHALNSFLQPFTVSHSLGQVF